jgi:hypothetical protein
MNVYSLWEQGRDLASGQYVSMIPLDFVSQGGATPVAAFSAPMQALSVVAQFGMYYELHRMRRLQEAQFEERRLGWLDSILDQWIEEHRQQPGLQYQVTHRIAAEVSTLIEKLGENTLVDIPQVLLLKLDRVTDFLQENYRLQSAVLNSLVLASNSDAVWLLESDLDFFQIARTRLEEAINEAAQRRASSIGWGMMGAALFIIPVAGPFLGGGALGASGTAVWDSHKAKRAAERLLEVPELLRFLIVADTLRVPALYLKEFLSAQRWKVPRRLMLFADDDGVRVVLAPIRTDRRTLGDPPSSAASPAFR